MDWIEVTTGGLDSRQKIAAKPGYQVPHATAVKKGLQENRYSNVIVSTVGMITKGPQASQILEDRLADAVAVGRAFLRNPGESPSKSFSGIESRVYLSQNEAVRYFDLAADSRVP